MADLDEISAGIGGLQADMKRAIAWFDKHEEADQRRFEALAKQINTLELYKAEAVGQWKAVAFLGTLTGALGSFVYHILGLKF
jgi:hypothetical protein